MLSASFSTILTCGTGARSRLRSQAVRRDRSSLRSRAPNPVRSGASSAVHRRPRIAARLSRGMSVSHSSKKRTASVCRTGGRTGSGDTTVSVRQAKIEASGALNTRSSISAGSLCAVPPLPYARGSRATGGALATPNIHQVVVVPAPGDQVLSQLMSVAGADKYQPVGQSPDGLVLYRRRIPVWAIVLAIFFFPIGLLFLLVKNDETVSIALTEVQGGTQVTITGQASQPMQSALQYALSGYAATPAGLPPPGPAYAAQAYAGQQAGYAPPPTASPGPAP